MEQLGGLALKGLVEKTKIMERGTVDAVFCRFGHRRDIGVESGALGDTRGGAPAKHVGILCRDAVRLCHRFHQPRRLAHPGRRGRCHDRRRHGILFPGLRPVFNGCGALQDDAAHAGFDVPFPVPRSGDKKTWASQPRPCSRCTIFHANPRMISACAARCWRGRPLTRAILSMRSSRLRCRREKRFRRCNSKKTNTPG